MLKEIIAKWIKAIGNGVDEDILWLKIEEEIKVTLNPLREKIMKDQNSIRNLELKLKDSQDELYFYKEALRALPNPIFIKDDKTRFCFFNRKYEEMFGMNADSYVGKRVYDLEYLPEADREKYQVEDERMIKESSIVHYEVPFTWSDGKVHESFYWSRGFKETE